MPACYAHYRFGCAMLPTLPEDIRRTIGRFRRLYDLGVHGPDPFFYHIPGIRDSVYRLGSAMHNESGEVFFTRACRNLRLNPSEAATSYLYGVLTHYALDSCCHPFINEQAEKGPAVHTQIEAELERYLLVLDGKLPPEEQDVSVHMRITPGERETAARFYPGISAGKMGRCVKNMALCTKLLVIPRGRRRDLVRRGLDFVSRDASGLLIPLEPDPACCGLDARLMELYREAEQLFPVLAQRMGAHLRDNSPLGSVFARSFG